MLSWVGSLSPPPIFSIFRIHGPRTRTDDLSAPWGKFSARVTASVSTVDRDPGRGWALPTADNDFASVFAVPTEVGTGSAEASAAATTVALPTCSRISTEGTDTVEPTGSVSSTSASPGSPAPQTVKPSSDRLSTRTRRRSATAAGKTPRAVDYDFGPGGTPRASSRRVTTPPRVPRLRPTPPTAATPAPAASPAPTVTFPSDRYRAEPVGTPLLRLTPPPGDMPTAPTKSNAFGDAAPLRFTDSVARYSHADWKQTQHAEPTGQAAMRYITVGRPLSLPPDLLSCYPSHKRPSLLDVQKLAGKG